MIGDSLFVCIRVYSWLEAVDFDFYDPETVAFCATWGIEVCTDVELMGKLRTC